MGHLKIYCDSCGGDWVVYHRDDWKSWKARTCPICGHQIDGETWERQILPAFGEMEAANLELMKDHSGYHRPLFTVNYESDSIFPNKCRTDIVDQIIEALREEPERILESILSIEGGHDA